MESSALAAETASKTSVWTDIRDSIRGVHHDYTEGSLNRAILLLSIPMVLEMCMESLFGVVNVFWVARLGATAAASVAITESLLTLVFAIAIGLSMATTATVARRIGEKDTEGASVAAAQSVISGTVVGVIVGVIGLVFAPELLTIMGAQPDVIASGSGYTRITLGLSIIIVMLFLINAIFRGAGDAAIAMRVLWISNAVNLVLDPCFIFGIGPFPELGVTGSGIATAIGRGTGVLYQLWMLTNGRGRVTIRKFTYDSAVMRSLLNIAWSGVVQYFVATASWVALTRIVATFGSAALAGYTIAIRIILFALLPSWGMSNAAATLVGQNLGAQKPERAEHAVWRTGVFNMIFLGIVSLILIVFAQPVLGIFTDDPQIVPFGVAALRFVSYGYVFYAWGMVTTQAFNGAGDTRTPTMINLCCYWLFQIPLAYALSLELGADGVFYAITLAESFLAAAGILMFRRGTWKNQKV